MSIALVSVSRVVARDAQIHCIEIGDGPFPKRHHDPLAVGRKAWRESHAGEGADRLSLAGFQIEQRRFRIGLAERHVSDLLRRRRKARRDDELFAAGQVLDVAAVHIHQREPLAALLLRAALVDEYDAAVEEALLAGDAREDRVGDEMGDSARVRAVGRILLSRDLFACRGVPQPELRGDMAAVGARDAAGDDELRVYRLPRVHIRAHVGIRDRFGEGGRIERREENRMGQVVAEHRADLGRAFVAGERRHRDRDRREIRAGMNVDVAGGARRGRCERERRADRQREKQTAGRRNEKGHQKRFHEVRITTARGRNRRSWSSIADNRARTCPAREADRTP